MARRRGLPSAEFLWRVSSQQSAVSSQQSAVSSQQSAVSSQQYGVVRVVRDGKPWGINFASNLSYRPAPVEIDGRVVGILEPGASLAISLTPGSHIIRIVRDAPGLAQIGWFQRKAVLLIDKLRVNHLEKTVHIAAGSNSTLIYSVQWLTGETLRLDGDNPYSLKVLGLFGAVGGGFIPGALIGAALGAIFRPTIFGISIPLAVLTSNAAVDQAERNLLLDHLWASAGSGGAIGAVLFVLYAATRK